MGEGPGLAGLEGPATLVSVLCASGTGSGSSIMQENKVLQYKSLNHTKFPYKIAMT